MRKTFFGCLLMASLTAPLAAQAAEATLNAILSKPLPTAHEVALRALDDSDEAVALKSQIEKGLESRGYRLNPNSPLILTFEIQDEVGAYTYTDRRYFVDLGARGSRTGGEDAHARFNVFDSKTGGIMNEGHGGTKIVTPTKYRLKLTLDAPADAGHIERYWQGWATANLGNADNETLIRAMVLPLLDTLGKTVKNQTFDVPD